MTDIRGRHVLVAGGTQGIGLEIARLAVAQGANVSLIARDANRLDNVAHTLAAPREVATSPADACDPDQLARAVNTITDVHGPIDVAISCVGGSLPGTFASTPMAEFRSQMDLNYFSAVNLAQIVTPAMVSRRSGHIVFVSSTAGLVGVFGLSAYTASKFAVRGFAETLRYELEPAGVKVSVLYPPDTVTPGFEAENLRKPPETAAVSGSIKPRDPSDIAARALSGIAHDRFTITADGQTRMLSRIGGLLDPVVHRTMARQIRNAQRAASDTPNTH